MTHYLHNTDKNTGIYGKAKEFKQFKSYVIAILDVKFTLILDFMIESLHCQ